MVIAVLVYLVLNRGFGRVLSISVFTIQDFMYKFLPKFLISEAQAVGVFLSVNV